MKKIVKLGALLLGVILVFQFVPFVYSADIFIIEGGVHKRFTSGIINGSNGPAYKAINIDESTTGEKLHEEILKVKDQFVVIKGKKRYVLIKIDNTGEKFEIEGAEALLARLREQAQDEPQVQTQAQDEENNPEIINTPTCKIAKTKNLYIESDNKAAINPDIMLKVMKEQKFRRAKWPWLTRFDPWYLVNCCVHVPASFVDEKFKDDALTRGFEYIGKRKNKDVKDLKTKDWEVFYHSKEASNYIDEFKWW